MPAQRRRLQEDGEVLKEPIAQSAQLADMPAPHSPRQRSPEEIARRAYELYERRGGEPGRDLDDWLEAERGG
jgi:hypothetical protein